MIEMYVVDAFTDKLFTGNPAAVCLIKDWPTDKQMQQIASENNYSETAFTIKKDEKNYELRWFTPSGEIDLCGHATLATAFVIFLNEVKKTNNTLMFHTRSGILEVIKKDDLYEMSFPSYTLTPVVVTEKMTNAFGIKPIEAYLGRDLLAVFSKEEDVEQLQPDLKKVKELDGLLQHVSSIGKKYDIVSRSFAPKLGISEDPVCGSGHCHIVPYWAKKLQQNHLIAFQASKRTGVLDCTYQGAVTKIAGQAVLYSQGEITI